MHRFARLALGLGSLCTLTLGSPARGDFDRASGTWRGDASPANFSEFCRDALSPARRSTFDAEFARADAALASRDPTMAEAAMTSALATVYRGGGESDLSIKCLGESIAQRWFETTIELDRQLSARVDRGNRVELPELRSTAVDRGSDAVVSRVQLERPKKFVAAVRVLERIAQRLADDRDYGAFMLRQENALSRTCRDALRALRQFAEGQRRNALAAEQVAFTGPISDRELAAMNMAENAESLKHALAGVDADDPAMKELFVLHARTRESQEYLRQARIWNLDPGDDLRSRPSSRRSLKRGDELLARANDTASNVTLRDGLYSEAKSYYEFGGFDDAADSVATARSAIETTLRADRARREAAFEKAAGNMRSEADQLRSAAEKMKKSEAEKQIFNDEAKAMEDELGF